jgi:hypothetical protein
MFLIFIFSVFAGTDMPHTLYGKVNIDGTRVKVYLENESDFISDTVGLNGNFGVSNWWKINLYNLPYDVEDNQKIIVSVDKNGYSASTNIFINLSKGNERVSDIFLEYCGDGSCNGPEECSSCEIDCGDCDDDGGSGRSRSRGGSSSCVPVYDNCTAIEECSQDNKQEAMCYDSYCGTDGFVIKEIDCEFSEETETTEETEEQETETTQESEPETEDQEEQETKIEEKEDQEEQEQENLITGNLIQNTLSNSSNLKWLILLIIGIIFIFIIFSRKRDKK